MFASFSRSFTAATISFRLMAFMAISFAVGCAAEIHQPRLNAKLAARTAMQTYDQNSDGLLDENELARTPGLRAALPSGDTDRDKKLSEKEIHDRVAAYWKEGIAIMPFQCQVTLNGQPLANATVTLAPEDFLGPEIQAASDTTDASGNASLKISGVPLRGVHCGMFRLRVTKQDASGLETIPAKYNTETTLGFEVALDVPSAERGQLISLSNN